MVLVVPTVFIWNAWQSLNTPMHVTAELSFGVEPGVSLGRIADQLSVRGVLTNPLYLKVYARITGEATQIKAGEYHVKSVLTPIDLLDILVGGRVVQHQFTIVEGWSFHQLRAALYDMAPLLDIRTASMSVSELMSSIGYPNTHPEGQFLPDTYYFPHGTSDIAFLRRAYHSMQDYLRIAWENNEAGLAIGTPYEALILASIVEKETAAEHERPLIAAVFMSRLRINMRLQTDPTVIYGLGENFDGNLRRKHLRQDTEYNTYTRRGLVPTPIAMPGKKAIDAVLHPGKTDALYFVSRGDGTHHFSRTLLEHQAAVDKYQRKRSTKSQ